MCHSRRRLLGQVRLNYVAKCISGLYYEPEFLQFTGNHRAGTYATYDGCGNYDLFAWNEAGFVAGSKEKNSPRPGDADPDTADAHQCFPGLPDALAPLAEAVIAASFDKWLTGGLWILSAPTERWHEEGYFTIWFHRYTKLPEVAMGDGWEP